MNKQRRKEINAVIDRLEKLEASLQPLHYELEQIKDELEQLVSDEQEAFDNLSDSLQASTRGTDMEHAISQLESARDDVESLFKEIDGFDIAGIVGQLDDAKGGSA